MAQDVRQQLSQGCCLEMAFAVSHIKCVPSVKRKTFLETTAVVLRELFWHLNPNTRNSLQAGFSAFWNTPVGPTYPYPSIRFLREVCELLCCRWGWKHSSASLIYHSAVVWWKIMTAIKPRSWMLQGCGSHPSKQVLTREKAIKQNVTAKNTGRNFHYWHHIQTQTNRTHSW